MQAGVSPGCDTMPWTTDAKLTGNFCAHYTWSNGGNALYTCANSVNDGKYAYNNLAAYYETWYHRINATWHTDTEAWYQYMRDTPKCIGSTAPILPPASSTPTPPAPPGPRPPSTAPVRAPSTSTSAPSARIPASPPPQQPARCYAPERAITNYVEHNFWHNTASLNIRNEFVDDIKGQRTGTPAKYEEHMVGFDFWAGSTITFRPELSYTHAYAKYGAHRPQHRTRRRHLQPRRRLPGCSAQPPRPRQKPGHHPRRRSHLALLIVTKGSTLVVLPKPSPRRFYG